ncbi:MAG TPA: hypothetical protein VGQ39_12900 [Pyrinomonadaceae bacterium]|jgi:hypothetical protein|nr:hypothetical protein [Pyrinomonadaceae bacterium]
MTLTSVLRTQPDTAPPALACLTSSLVTSLSAIRFCEEIELRRPLTRIAILVQLTHSPRQNVLPSAELSSQLIAKLLFFYQTAALLTGGFSSTPDFVRLADSRDNL